MRFLKALFFTCLVLAGVLYAGVKGYIYYRVTSALDEAIAGVALFAEVTYRDVSSSIDGTVAVRDIRVYPRGIEDEVAIDAVEVKGNGPEFLLKAAMGEYQKELPQELEFGVKGLRLALNGPLASSFLNSAKGMPSGNKDVCELGGVFSPKELGRFGLQVILANLSLRYRLEKAQNQMQVRVEFDTEGLNATALDFTLAGLPSPGTMMSASPKFRDFSIQYRIDPDFAGKVTDYCARSRSQTVAAYIDSVLEVDDEKYAQALGFVPGPGMRRALRDFMENPEEIHLSANPSEPLDLTTLAFYKPEDAVGLLNLNVRVNGKPVDDLSFSRYIPPPPVAPADETDISRAEVPATQQATPRQTARPKPSTMASKLIPKVVSRHRTEPRFIALPVDELSQHIGRTVRLHTLETAPRSGELMAIERGVARVSQRVYQGRMEAYVPLPDIEKAEILELER